MKTVKNGKNTMQKNPIDAAKAYGIDIYALMMNLKRTPYERIRRHQLALNTLEMLRKAKGI
jgi:hypothetical protein